MLKLVIVNLNKTYKKHKSKKKISYMLLNYSA